MKTNTVIQVRKVPSRHHRISRFCRTGDLRFENLPWWLGVKPHSDSAPSFLSTLLSSHPSVQFAGNEIQKHQPQGTCFLFPPAAACAWMPTSGLCSSHAPKLRAARGWFSSINMHKAHTKVWGAAGRSLRSSFHTQELTIYGGVQTSEEPRVTGVIMYHSAGMNQVLWNTEAVLEHAQLRRQG